MPELSTPAPAHCACVAAYPGKTVMQGLFDDMELDQCDTRKRIKTDFYDYESFLKKFTDAPKTTDDCYTPPDVYEAVLRYVGSIYDLKGKKILRPFYPGGDYMLAEYPADGVVIDNPPFSMFTNICRFYVKKGVKFFLFGPGLTIFSVVNDCTCVIINTDIEFSNKAKVRCNFATNLLGDVAATTAPELDRMICECKSQNQKANLPKYKYPDNLLSVSDMQTICHNGVKFEVHRAEAVMVRNLDRHPFSKKGLFGNHLLISDAKAQAKAQAKFNCTEDDRIIVELSERERKIIEKL
jgi:hypothetical protein